MSILASTDLASRLTLPSLTDSFKVSCRVIFLVGSVLLCIVRAGLAETTGRTALLVMCGVYGYIRAATVVNQSLVVAEYIDNKERIAGALGLNMCAKGLFVITLGQLLGRFYLKCGYKICTYLFFVFRLDKRLLPKLSAVSACTERSPRHCDNNVDD